mgnify:CR=1 FL=1
MRLPKRTDLSEEQEDFLLEAPFDRPVLCIGPPGTGKTVLALYRGVALSKKDKEVQFIMHGKLLTTYTTKALEELDVPISPKTWNQWVARLWSQANGGYRIPQIEAYLPNFNRTLELLSQGIVRNPDRLYWDHLIIDEGQDFPKEFYMFLSFLSVDKKVCAGRPASGLTVFADDNQRLEEGRNSTIDQIKTYIPNCETYSIRKNFRNSAPIAKLAAYFYIGLQTGMPDIPENVKGPTPQLKYFDTCEEEMTSVVNWAYNNDDCSCGIIVPDKKTQTKLFKILKAIAEEKDIQVQRYSSGQDASSLDFHSGGWITIICDKSCKGLDFDAVFLPQLHEYRTDGADETFFRMKMYVMISRARQFLQMSFSDCSNRPAVLEMLPSSDQEILAWQI